MPTRTFLRAVTAFLLVALSTSVFAQSQTDDALQPMAAVSADAQAVYKTARDKLLQIRTLRRKTNTQSSVGSGFYVRADGLIVTNFHVASQAALDPDKHRLVAVNLDAQEIEVELVAFDVQHDLALLMPKTASPQPRAFLSLRGKEDALKRGERIFSLGNPLDVGFAITEGAYNGPVQRSFYSRIFFGGTLNPGMSGGPALDARGRVLGINVAKRLDGEQVSFLIPVEFAQALIQRNTLTGSTPQPIRQAAHAKVAAQLLAHQDALVERFVGTPMRFEKHGGYAVPVPDEKLARCWGEGRARNSKSQFDFERSDCRIDAELYAGDVTTGDLHLRYEAYDGSRLHPQQFAHIYSQSFANEYFRQRGTRDQTKSNCQESYVERPNLPMRVVLCMSAYKKFTGLYDASVLVMTLNQPKRGVQGRLDARGLSFDNSLKVVQHYLNGFAWEATP
jgi:serine protease Do